LKLIAESNTTFNQSNFSEQSDYIIMFGPDRCSQRSKVFFVVCKQHHKTKQFEEKHWIHTHVRNPSDFLTHLYTLHIQKNNTASVYIDQELVAQGDMLKSFDPPLNPLKMIYDADDKKPADWDEREFIPDPRAVMPSHLEDAPMIPDPVAIQPPDWIDVPSYIPDPAAKKPSDWDESNGEWKPPVIQNPRCKNVQNCGEWNPPMIANPRWKGRWSPPQIKNPKYKGEWKQKLIPNPYYEEDLQPHNFPRMIGVGFEILTNTNATMFDNILITYNKEVADAFAAKTWAVKIQRERQQHREEFEAKNKVDWVAKLTELILEYPFAAFFTIAAVLFPVFIFFPMFGVPSAPPKPKLTT